MALILQIRSDTRDAWASENPILAEGEMGAEQNPDTGFYDRAKMGDGIHTWNTLPYSFTGGAVYDPCDLVPLMNGTAAEGEAITFARGDHIHPHDITKANQATTYTKSEVDDLITDLDVDFGAINTHLASLDTAVSGLDIAKANKNAVYTKAEIETKFGERDTAIASLNTGKADKTAVYTKLETDVEMQLRHGNGIVKEIENQVVSFRNIIRDLTRFKEFDEDKHYDDFAERESLYEEALAALNKIYKGLKKTHRKEWEKNPLLNKV
jgi:hypothetical protein